MIVKIKRAYDIKLKYNSLIGNEWNWLGQFLNADAFFKFFSDKGDCNLCNMR